MKDRYKFGFVLSNNFTLTALSIFIDMLRLAGDQGDRSDKGYYDWEIIGDRGLPITSSCGVSVMPTVDAQFAGRCDHLVVIGGLLHRGKAFGNRLLDTIQVQARSGKPLSAVCTASFTLAELGLLDGYRTCVSWFHIDDFRHRYPQIAASAEELFIVDGNRATCSGGAGVTEFVAAIISRDLGALPARKASRILLFDQTRTTGNLQPFGLAGADIENHAVRRALLIMVGNLETTRTIDEIAEMVGKSGRQLQRLFRNTIGRSPLECYQDFRLLRAAELIRNTSRTLSAVAADVGFAHESSLTRSFQKKFRKTPSTYRREYAVAGESSRKKGGNFK